MEIIHNLSSLILYNDIYNKVIHDKRTFTTVLDILFNSNISNIPLSYYTIKSLYYLLQDKNIYLNINNIIIEKMITKLYNFLICSIPNTKNILIEAILGCLMKLSTEKNNITYIYNNEKSTSLIKILENGTNIQKDYVQGIITFILLNDNQNTLVLSNINKIEEHCNILFYNSVLNIINEGMTIYEGIYIIYLNDTRFFFFIFYYMS